MQTVLVDLTPLDTPNRDRGIGRYLRNLATGLSRLGPAELGGLRLLALTQLGWTGRHRVSESLDSFVGSPDRLQPSKADQLRWAYQRRVALWRAARRIRPALLHLGDPNATPVGMSLSGCPRLLTCHDLIPLRYPTRYFTLRDGFGLLGRRILIRRYRSADHVVAISDATRRDLTELCGLPPAQISMVPNGVPIERWSHEASRHDDECRRRHHLNDRAYVLYVGDTDWRKNVRGMLGGLARARDAGADLTLALAGKLDQRKLRHLAELARQYGVSAAVKPLGYVSDADLAALYRGAVALLFVSRYEGFGLPLVEAMACGCPVVTTRGGSLCEVAADAAWLVEPDDHHGIGEALRTLAADPAERRKWSARGLARAPQFSLERHAHAMVRLYQRLIFGRAGPMADQR